MIIAEGGLQQLNVGGGPYKFGSNGGSIMTN